MNTKQREEIIINAIKHITNAYQASLVKGVWGSKNYGKRPLVDALACVIIETDEEWLKLICEDDGAESEELEKLAANILQTNTDWTESFALGFQNVPRNLIGELLNETAYKCGKKVSKATGPIAFHILAVSKEISLCVCGDCYKEKPTEEPIEEEEEEEEYYEEEEDDLDADAYEEELDEELNEEDDEE